MRIIEYMTFMLAILLLFRALFLFFFSNGRMTKNRTFIYLLIFTTSLHLNAQTSEELIPYSSIGSLPELTSFVDMKEFDANVFLNEIIKNKRPNLKEFMFAKTFDTNISPENSGEWSETSKGKVWRVGIRSKNAYSIYLTCNPFLLNKTVKAFVYAPNFNNLKGPFSIRDNNRFNILSFPIIPGDVVIVELDVPEGVYNYGKLVISKVYHDCNNEFGRKNVIGFVSKSDSCTQDINCENGKYWQTEKRAVCKIVSDGKYSTGTLIGNTSGSKEPYILTANHAIPDSEHAAGALYYFNYETQICGDNIINESQYIVGGSLVSTTEEKLDFTLIKLNNTPPLSFSPYYAGWDNRNVVPERGVCIHHPWGTEKQIAIDYHSLRAGSFSPEYDSLAYWNIQHWEIGTTKPGSSGAPLFNPQHRVVGTLTGGEASCSNSVDDYFSKFALTWNKYPDSKNQLKAWLDPENKGLEYIDGYDPYGFNTNNCDTAWNFQPVEKLGLSNAGLSWGWLSGHNSAGFTQFAEKFISTASIQIPGVFINVAKAYHSQTLSNIVVKVWEGNEVPFFEKYAKMVFIKNLQSNAINYIAFDSIVKVSGNFFIGYEINYSTPSDTFAVYQTIEPVHAESSSMYIFNGSWENINSNPSTKLSASLGIGIMECYGKVHKVPVSHLRVYPNPCVNRFSIDLPEGIIVSGCECFDLSGRKIAVELLYSEDNKNTIGFNLPSGVYILKLTTNKGFLYTKFIVSNITKNMKSS